MELTFTAFSKKLIAQGITGDEYEAALKAEVDRRQAVRAAVHRKAQAKLAKAHELLIKAENISDEDVDQITALVRSAADGVRQDFPV